MTNREFLNNLSNKDLAIYLLSLCNDGRILTVGNGSYYTYKEALQAQIEWLEKEIKDGRKIYRTSK